MDNLFRQAVVLKKSILLLGILVSAMPVFCQSGSYDPNRQYSVSELKADFKFLRNKLEKKHPNLYLYTPKETLNAFLDSLDAAINHPMDETEFYNIITLLNSKIRDGHTMMLPGSAAMDYNNKNAGFLPLFVLVQDGRLLVHMNCSADTLLKPGAEISSINGTATKDILSFLVSRQIRDGWSDTYPEWILTNYFKEYYSFSYGHPDAYRIAFKNQNNDTGETTIPALTKDSIRFYKTSKYAHRIQVVTDQQGITLKTDSLRKSAVLTIKSFDKDILRSTYQQQFGSSIREAFKKISENNIQHLVVDLRNNQGGDFEPGRILLSYLLLQPVAFLPGSNEQSTVAPLENNYKGKLYVLINGGSFSITGIIASYLESTKRAVFIGEEAAGNKIILSGNPVTKTLPNTNIECQVSSNRFVIDGRKNEGHGVIPANIKRPSVADIIAGVDPAMDYANKIIWPFGQ